MPAPIALLQLREFPLHLVGGTTFHLSHQISYRKFRRDRDKHVHMVTCQHTLDDLDTIFGTNLTNDFSHPQLHITTKNLVAIFGDPYEMIAVIKCAVFTFGVLHDHTFQKNEP